MTKLIALLKQAGLNPREHGNNVGRNFVNICCPFCEEQGFHGGIHREKLWFKCLVCGEPASWYKLREVLLRKYPAIDWFQLGTTNNFYLDTDTNVPKELQELTKPIIKGSVAYDYLTEIPYTEELHDTFRPRGIEPHLLDSYLIGEGINALKGYITFREGNNIIGRSFSTKTKSRYHKVLVDDYFIYGKEACGRIQPQWITITEGVFDTISCPFGHSLSLLGSITSTSWFSALIDAIPNVTTDIILALDKSVKRKTINTYKLLLSDCGLNVHEWDWNKPEYTDTKDLDEVRLVYGREHITRRCEEYIGYRSTEQEILNLL